MISSALLSEIFSSVSPDRWNKKWSVTNRFGGGMAIELEVGLLMYSFVRTIKPDVVIETGTHKGFSSLIIADAIKNNGTGHLYTIDTKDYGVSEEFKKFGLESFSTFLQGKSTDVIRDLSNRIQKVDFLWLDADHSEHGVLDELAEARTMIKPGTYIAFHDSIVDSGENAAIIKTKQKNPSWEHIRFFSARGLDLMRVV
jgi:predicted O-methyltransferase YrrM